MDGMKIAFVSSSIPRRCGIATFTADIMAAVKAADPTVRTSVVAIDEPNSTRAYGAEVKARIRQRDPATYRAAATLLNESNVDAVNIHHEFGLYGVWKDGVYEDHLRPLLLELRKPAVTTLHSVLPDPPPSMRDAVRSIAAHRDELVVMAPTAARLLKTDYGITKTPAVIPHRMPP